GVAPSGPLHLGGHGREDRLDVAAGLEAKGGAAVVEEVELDVAAAADELLVAIGGGPWGGEVAADDGGVGVDKGGSDVAREGEVGVPVARVVVVVEDAADAARLVAVR